MVPPTVVDHFDLVANVPVAAAQLEITRPLGTTSVTASALQPDVVVRLAEVGDRIHIVWVGPVAIAGPQVRLDVERAEGTSGGAEVVTASAFASSTGPDVGPDVFAWRTVSASVQPDASAGIDGFPFEGMGALALAPSFADHPLGDLNDDFALDVRDALVWMDLVRHGNWTDYLRYHADFDADDDADADDLTELLDKLVDPSLPARLHVRPDALSFVELDPATDQDAIVLIANRGRLDFANLDVDEPPGVVVESLGGVPRTSAALRLTLPAANRIGWQPGMATIRDGAGGETDVRVGHLVLLVAGQSNASGRGYPLLDDPAIPSVRMLANDYRWKIAREPLDDPSGQLDTTNPERLDENARYSFGTRLGQLLVESTGYGTYLVPAAHGGSGLTDWLPVDVYDRQTLFGSAHVRARVSAGLTPNPQVNVLPYEAEGGPVNAVLWYQGETDAGAASTRSRFVDRTNTVMGRFEALIGAPMVYVQLASHGNELDHERQLLIAELQRTMETAERFMVVAFDLPRSDVVHLSAYGQRVLAERIELAVREHVLGENVDGTGPRLVGVEYVGGRRIDVTTTHELAGTIDEAHVRVFDGPPSGDVDDPTTGYATNALPVASVAIDPSDARVVRVTLAADPPAGSDLHVSYWALPGLPDSEAYRDVLAPGVIRAADGGLPLPAFGPLPVQ